MTGTVRRLPAALGRWLRDSPLTQDALISNIEYVLAPALSAASPHMADIDRYRPDDRRQVEALYRRVFGPDTAEANRLRWDWQYRRNPQRAGRRSAHLDRARGHDHRRPVRDDAGARCRSTAARSTAPGAWT